MMTADSASREPPAPLPSAEEVAAFVRRELNQIHDPCGQALGVVIGLDDMGLVRNLEVRRHSQGWEVDLKLRLTAPGCTYYFYFERQIRERLAVFTPIAALTVTYDPVTDWTPEDMREAARARLLERRRRVQIALEEQAAISSERPGGS